MTDEQHQEINAEMERNGIDLGDVRDMRRSRKWVEYTLYTARPRVIGQDSKVVTKTVRFDR